MIERTHLKKRITIQYRIINDRRAVFGNVFIFLVKISLKRERKREREKLWNPLSERNDPSPERKTKRKTKRKINGLRAVKWVRKKEMSDDAKTGLVSTPIFLVRLERVEMGGTRVVSWPSGAPTIAVRTWLRADKANFVKCASGTERVKRVVEGVAGPIRKLSRLG